MKRISREKFVLTMSPQDEPVLRVESGSTIVLRRMIVLVMKFKAKINFLVRQVGTQLIRLPVPINPMLGVIGTAPSVEEIPTGTPGMHGANMDCKRIVKGSILYPGALLSIGDLHAVQQD